MATNNFLDQAGLGYLWTKILSAIESHSVTLPDKLVSYKTVTAIAATEKLNADTLGGYSATYFAKNTDVSAMQETIQTQANEILKAQEAVSNMQSTVDGHGTSIGNLEDSIQNITVSVSSLVKDKADSIHAAQHAKDGSDPITPESIGAAPGGFGLGGGSKMLTPDDDLNNIWEAGWYTWDAAPKNAPTVGGSLIPYCSMNVLNKGSAYNIHQIVYTFEGYEIHRYYDGGKQTWSEWAWVNPPMMVGIEYRTTEYYFGKPVYAKTFNIPTSVFTDQGPEYAHGIANLNRIVDAFVCCRADYIRILPWSYYASAGWSTQYMLNSSTIKFELGASALKRIKAYTNGVDVTLKYTKTID